MKFNYKLRRLCGSYYGHPLSSQQWSGSNVVYDPDGNQLISAALNRIQIIDLKTVSVRTLPFEARSNIRCLARSNHFLVVVDVQDYASLVHLHRGIVLHRFRLKRPVRVVEFSPSGRYLAFGLGAQVQVWLTPTNNHAHAFCPMQLHRTYTGLTDDVTSLLWSPDESVVGASSRDGTVRIWTVHTTLHYEPVTLSGGHKTAVVGVFLGDMKRQQQQQMETVYTVSADGALVTWECTYQDDLTIQVVEGEETGVVQTDAVMNLGDEAVDFFTGGAGTDTKPLLSSTSTTTSAHELVKGKWSIRNRHYFNQEGQSKVSSTSYCRQAKLLAVGFTSGVFGLYEMPDCTNIHTLSVGSEQLVKACSLNHTGEWLALACPKSQQLLVWEWRSETYVLKQRGHAYGMRCMAYSPDAVCVATGGEDGKLKLWNASTGFCYVTFGGGDGTATESSSSTHTAPVTAVTFAKASVILTASLDGTVKAHDLHRYRTFRTMTTPTPVQFLSLAVDADGEVVVAGSADPFHIYVWSLQTGKLLDILTGHAGPVCDLSLHQGVLASASWDGTVKTWDVYKGGNVPMDSLQHSTDVVCVAFSPDGTQLCSGTIGGLLSFWNVTDGKLLFEIDGRRDICGGRKLHDRRTAHNNASSRYFTSVCYSADGTCVLAGGNSKFVCIYEVSQQMLLKKFQVSFNRSLDGVLDELNSKNLGDGGPVDEEIDSGDETTYNALQLPGARRGDDGSRRSRVEVLTAQVSYSSTGREWAVVSGEGLHIYSLDDDMLFDPISLTEAMTPAAVLAKVGVGEYGLALRMAIHLNEFQLVKLVLEETPVASIPLVVRSVRAADQLERLLQFIAKVASDSPHVEFYVTWCLELMQTHGSYMDRNRSRFGRAVRALHQVVSTQYVDLRTICDSNRYALEVCHDQGTLLMDIAREGEEQTKDVATAMAIDAAEC